MKTSLKYGNTLNKLVFHQDRVKVTVTIYKKKHFHTVASSFLKQVLSGGIPWTCSCFSLLGSSLEGNVTVTIYRNYIKQYAFNQLKSIKCGNIMNEFVTLNKFKIYSAGVAKGLYHLGCLVCHYFFLWNSQMITLTFHILVPLCLKWALLI